jgi:hypothetical protein
MAVVVVTTGGDPDPTGWGLGWRSQSPPADGVVRTPLTSEVSCARHEIRIKAARHHCELKNIFHGGLAQQQQKNSEAPVPWPDGTTCVEARAATAESSSQVRRPPGSHQLHQTASLAPQCSLLSSPVPLGEREEPTHQPKLPSHHSVAPFRLACPTLPRRAQAKQ